MAALTPAMGSLATAGPSQPVSFAPRSVREVFTFSPAEGKKPPRLRLIIDIGYDPDQAMATVRYLGIPTAQLWATEFQPDLVKRLRQALKTHALEPTALMTGGPSEEFYDFYGGPRTIGLVPHETRLARIAQLKKASDFAKECGIPAVQTHCGFIPIQGSHPRDTRSGCLLPAQWSEFPLRDRPGDAHHAGPCHR